MIVKSAGYCSGSLGSMGLTRLREDLSVRNMSSMLDDGGLTAPKPSKRILKSIPVKGYFFREDQSGDVRKA